MALTQISTAGVKDDAVTSGKIPANAVGSSELADNAVDTAAIADTAVTLAKLEHGTSSNDGKFLRANNGADPTFETVTSTTINNNADNRLITGSGTANTLNGEANLTFDGTGNLVQSGSAAASIMRVETTANDGDALIQAKGKDSSGNDRMIQMRTDAGADQYRIISSDTSYNLALCTGNAERLTIKGDSTKVGIGTTNPNTNLHVLGSVNGGDLEALRLHNNNTSSGTKTTLAFTNTTDANVEHAKITATRDNSGRLDFFVGAQSHAVLCVDGYSSGVVGVNTVQASFPLDVNGKIRGHGILFGSDTATANTLDDYEEGTWSPQIYYQNSGDQNDSTNLAQYGWYQKVGNVVHVSFFLRWSLSGSAANDNIGVKNFPFVQSPVTSTYGDAGGVGSISHSGTSLNATDCIVLKAAGSGSTLMYLEDIGAQGNRGNEFGANNGMRVWGSVTFRTT